MKKALDIEFEKAVRLLVEYMPAAKEDSRKSPLAHDIRVGAYLYEKNYARDIVLAGILHDAIEWSEFSENRLKAEFGDNVWKIVLACSKNRTIENSEERIADLIQRCVAVGEEALIVKTVDTIDSFKHYTKTDNQNQLVKHCQKTAEAIFKYKPSDFKDPIFEELRGWIKK